MQYHNFLDQKRYLFIVDYYFLALAVQCHEGITSMHRIGAECVLHTFEQIASLKLGRSARHSMRAQARSFPSLGSLSG